MYTSPSVAPSVCSQAPYAPYLPLKGFAPAVAFCSAYEANENLPSIPTCSDDSLLCSLSRLTKCDRDVISTVCTCIGSAPSVTVTVPMQTSTTPTKDKKTEATETKATKTEETKTEETNTKATKTKKKASTTTAAAPVCSNSLILVVPTPSGAVCEQRGTVSAVNTYDDVTQLGSGGGFAASIEDCAQQCLALTWCCATTEFNPTTGACMLFFQNAAAENFVANPASPFLVSDVVCFQSCTVAASPT